MLYNIWSQGISPPTFCNSCESMETWIYLHLKTGQQNDWLCGVGSRYSNYIVSKMIQKIGFLTQMNTLDQRFFWGGGSIYLEAFVYKTILDERIQSKKNVESLARNPPVPSLTSTNFGYRAQSQFTVWLKFLKYVGSDHCEIRLWRFSGRSRNLRW